MAGFGSSTFEVVPGSEWLAPARMNGEGGVARFVFWDSVRAVFSATYQVRNAGYEALGFVADLAYADLDTFRALADGTPRPLTDYPTADGALTDFADMLLLPVAGEPVPHLTAGGEARARVPVRFERPK